MSKKSPSKNADVPRRIKSLMFHRGTDAPLRRLQIICMALKNAADNDANADQWQLQELHEELCDALGDLEAVLVVEPTETEVQTYDAIRRELRVGGVQ